jgi:hypothetical protein
MEVRVGQRKPGKAQVLWWKNKVSWPKENPARPFDHAGYQKCRIPYFRTA